MENLVPFDSFLNEKLGVSDVVYRTAEKIYAQKNLKKWETKFSRSNLKGKMTLDTKEYEAPFNEMNLVIHFTNNERPKNRHGGMDRIDQNTYDIYIYHHCNNVFRTLAHELDHVYQVYLKKERYKTNFAKPSVLRKSEQSPIMMSVYTQLKQRGVKSKEEFIEKLMKLPKYKKYVEILDDPKQSNKNKAVADKMIKKMHKLYAVFADEK